MVLLTAPCKLKRRARCKRFPPLHFQTQCDALPPAGFFAETFLGVMQITSALPAVFLRGRWERATQALLPPSGRQGEGQGNSGELLPRAAREAVEEAGEVSLGGLVTYCSCLTS